MEEAEIKVIGIEDIQIPECCREGWESCQHVVRKPEKVKRNIAI